MSSDYLTFASELAREAGTLIRKNFVLGAKKEWKDDKSPITETDHAINDLVISRVKSAYPEHSILGEERSFEVPGSRLVWVCDPIDGTTPFSTGLPLSTFALALVEDGVSILGVIYDPYNDRLYTAELGKGAHMNGSPIHVSSNATFAQSHLSCESRTFFPLMPALLDLDAKVMRLYCITCPGVLVACGEFEATLFGGASPWDIAALKVIVEEAGGKVTDIEGNEQRYDGKIKGAIVSNGILHAELVEMIKRLC